MDRFHELGADRGEDIHAQPGEEKCSCSAAKKRLYTRVIKPNTRLALFYRREKGLLR